MDKQHRQAPPPTPPREARHVSGEAIAESGKNSGGSAEFCSLGRGAATAAANTWHSDTKLEGGSADEAQHPAAATEASRSCAALATRAAQPANMLPGGRDSGGRFLVGVDAPTTFHQGAWAENMGWHTRPAASLPAQ